MYFELHVALGEYYPGHRFISMSPPLNKALWKEFRL